MKKKAKVVVYVILSGALLYGFYYAWVSFPILTGYDAKLACTCAFVSGRTEASIDSTELGDFPFNLPSVSINLRDSTVTASILGAARQKAIFREGVGCTLVNGYTEREVRSQTFSILREGLNADTLGWPLGEKPGDSMPAGVDSAKLQTVIANAFLEPHAGKKQRTRAVVVVYRGQMVAEKYAPGFSKNTEMYGWSMAKSFTSALIGILVKKGKLKVDAPAPVPQWKSAGDPRHSITLRNLLQQESGLAFEEKYTKSSDVTRMLYQKGDMAAYAASHPMDVNPGTVFNYSSGNSNILARIIRQVVGEKDYAAFPFRELFYKAGMFHTSFEPDASGTFVGSSYINATARDFARFGLLYLKDGVVNGERILPEGWVKATTTPSGANPKNNYGYQFWLNGADRSGHRKYPDVPADMFYCDGFAYQFIYIIPSEDLVVVRLGLTFDRSFDENAFLRDIISCMPGRE